MPDFASLGIKVSTDGVASGAAELDQLAVSAERAEGAAQGVGPAYSVASQQMQASAAAARTSAAGFAVQANQMRMAGLSAGQYSMAMRLLPMQITDIVTGLASGQPAFMVAIQQGGQLRDSFGGFGNTLRALGSLITPARLAIGGLVGAGVLLAKAFFDGQKEAYELNRAIVLSGNSIGITRERVYELAEAIDEVIGTQRSAVQTLGQLITAGVGGENIQQFATVVQQLARAGQPAEETIKILSELGRAPVEAALKYNRTLNFLTAAQLEHLQALERDNRMLEAGATAQTAYTNAMSERVDVIDNELGLLQRVGRATGDIFSWMWDQILNIGRPESLRDQLAQAEAELRRLDNYAARFPSSSRATNPNLDKDREALATRIDLLKQELKALDDAAAADANRRKELEATLVAQENSRRLLERGRILETALASSRAADIQRELENSLSQYSAYEAQLEAERDAGLISITRYYEERRRILQGNTEAERKALDAEIRLLQTQRARIEEETQHQLATAKEGEQYKIRAEASARLVEIQTRIKNLQAEITRLMREREAQGTVLERKETAENKRIEDSIKDAEEAQRSYLRTLEQRYQRELDGFGQGERRRRFDAGRSDIDDRYEQQRLQLQRDRRRAQTQEERDRIDAELAIINDYHRQALDKYENYYRDLSELEGSFGLGAREALSNYLDSARNVAEQGEQLFTNAFQGMENALTGFVTSGKSGFKDFAESVIADLLRIQLRAAVLRIFGSALGAADGSGPASVQGAAAASGGNFAGPRAKGGPVDPGNSYLVGERGPELIIPRQPGMVIPNHRLGGTSVTINQVLHAAPGTDVAQFQAMLQQSKAEITGEILEGLSRGRYAGVTA